MFRRTPAPAPRVLGLLVALAGAGALGCLPGGAGAFDPVTLLAWLTLLAPSAGILAGAGGARAWPFGLAVPAVWGLVGVLAAARSTRALPDPLWAAALVAGFFLAGLGWGRHRSGRPELAARDSGVTVLVLLLLIGLPVGLGLGPPQAALAADSPGLASLLLDLSPLVLALDCAGWDWTHAHPEVYARSGVEWFQRHPWPGSLAGPASLVVGSLLAWLVPRTRT